MINHYLLHRERLSHIRVIRLLIKIVHVNLVYHYPRLRTS